MTFSSIAALFGAMVVLAGVPGVSVLAVAARSAASGFTHGVFTTIGIVVGDIVFIILAIYGLSILAEKMGALFVLVKYVGGAYLIWLGIELWRSKSNDVNVQGIVESSFLSSFLAGLFITLGDLKAIFFYLGFLPAFLDLSAVSFYDTGIIIITATVAVGGVKLAYAFIASRTSRLFDGSTASKGIGVVAGGVMIGIGLVLLATA